MGIYVEEKLPQVVEDRLQEVYDSIRNGEIQQIKRRKTAYKKWMGVAAAIAIIVTVPSVVYAAVAYFRKDVQQDNSRITYDFTINYELVPGEYEVEAEYMPEGFSSGGDGKFYGEDEQWLTVMPIYTMAELEKANEQIVVENIDRVEHMLLSGMEADVITFQEAGKFQLPTYIFLFNEREGYVLNIIAGYTVEQETLLQFADNLTVRRTGDGSFETADEKTAREQEAEDDARLALESEKEWDALLTLGIPAEKIAGTGDELTVYNGFYNCGYTVTDYAFLDSVEGFAQENFFDYGRFDGWLNADKTLKPYTRLQYDGNGNIIAEKQTGQEILRVDITVHNYSGQSEDIPLDFQLEYVEKTPDGAYTWAETYYDAVPEEHYELQMDNSAVYLDEAVNTQAENRAHFFYRELSAGEELSYTLLFVVDTDRKNDFLLCRVGSNSDIWMTENRTAAEIREGLDGYIRLE